MLIEYEKLRKTAIKIVKRMGLNIFNQEAQETMAILINMNSLWEVFLYEVVMKEAFKKKLDDYKQHSFAIIGKRRTICQDFYIPQKNFFDVKYRKTWEKNINSAIWDEQVRNDIVQVLGYMLALNVLRGEVIFSKHLEVKNENTKNYNENLEDYSISELQKNKRFYPIPYYIFNRETYEEFVKIQDRYNTYLLEDPEKVNKES